jgi:hypothetical protein
MICCPRATLYRAALNFGGVALHQNLTNSDEDHGGTNRLTISPSSLVRVGVDGV